MVDDTSRDSINNHLGASRGQDCGNLAEPPLAEFSRSYNLKQEGPGERVKRSRDIHIQKQPLLLPSMNLASDLPD